VESESRLYTPKDPPKAERVAEFLHALETDSGNVSGEGFEAASLRGYLTCFNGGLYYEAHDVLEQLWLRQGRLHADYAFHKGLIQLAGGFVHLRLQFLHPDHPKHGRRLAPSRRLLLLAEANLSRYPDDHLGLDVAEAKSLARKTADSIGVGSGARNPWSPDTRPMIG
jgi:predicted metal-dependent hydrolase